MKAFARSADGATLATKVLAWAGAARKAIRSFVLLVGVSSMSCAWPADVAAPLPARTFFQNADINAARLSPSGRWLAIATGAKSARVMLAVVDLEGKANPVVVANYEAADVRSFEWVNDDRLVFNLVDLQAGSGTQGFGPGLYSVRRDGSELRQLIRVRRDFFREAKAIISLTLEGNHRLLWIPRTGGDEVIIGEFQFDNHGELDAVSPKRLNVVTGRATPLGIGRPEHTVGWLFDAKGEPRVAEAAFQGQTEVFWRAPGQSAWRSIAKASSLSRPWEPVLVGGSDQLFVTTGSSAGTEVLRRFDFAANLPEEAVLVSTPGFDFQGQFIDEWSQSRILGIRVDTDAESTVWFDAEMKKLQQRADQRFPGKINRLSCLHCAPDSAVLVFSYSDQDAGSYWVFRPSSDAWEPVGKVRADIDPTQMAQLDLHRIRARDGEDLPVWVTLPRKKAAGAAPAVVLVHGGPWVRGGHWRWNADAQFLASRGYVVVEPEYRGSTGFGRPHFEGGWKRWGTTMQDDVADAVRWAVTRGLVDPKRVCVAGASYGGYATLMGLVRYPDLYKCGVAWIAVTDPRLLFEDTWASDMPKEARGFSLPTLIGDLQKDGDMLKAAAPVEHAAEIRAPLLMAFGGEDLRVPLAHGTRMRAAMRATGHEPEWVVYNDEGHGWLKVDNRVDFWERVERFLDKQLH